MKRDEPKTITIERFPGWEFDSYTLHPDSWQGEHDDGMRYNARNGGTNFWGASSLWEAIGFAWVMDNDYCRPEGFTNG